MFEGVVRCREARRVLKNYYPHGRSTPPWSCEDAGDELVQCAQPGGSVPRNPLLPRSAPGRRAECPGFGPAPPAEPSEPAAPDPPDADLRALPARKSCGHLPKAPDYPLILVEVLKGRVPCRVARRVLKTQYRFNNLDATIEAARPWGCAGPEGLIVCHKDPGPDHKAIRSRFP